MRIRLSQLRRIIKEEVKRTLTEAPGARSPRMVAAQDAGVYPLSDAPTDELAYMAAEAIMEDQNGNLGLSNEEAADDWMKWHPLDLKAYGLANSAGKAALKADIVGKLKAVNRQPDQMDSDGPDELAPQKTGWEHY